MWVSVGGELEAFADDETWCSEQARAGEDAPLDELLFSVCMFDRGWRETRGEDPSVAAVMPAERVRSRVNVRAHPSSASQIVTALAVGERAQLLGREGDWYHVRLPNGHEGYVSADWTRTLQ